MERGLGYTEYCLDSEGKIYRSYFLLKYIVVNKYTLNLLLGMVKILFNFYFLMKKLHTFFLQEKWIAVQ